MCVLLAPGGHTTQRHPPFHRHRRVDAHPYGRGGIGVEQGKCLSCLLLALHGSTHQFDRIDKQGVEEKEKDKNRVRDSVVCRRRIEWGQVRGPVPASLLSFIIFEYNERRRAEASGYEGINGGQEGAGQKACQGVISDLLEKEWCGDLKRRAKDWWD